MTKTRPRTLAIVLAGASPGSSPPTIKTLACRRQQRSVEPHSRGGSRLYLASRHISFASYLVFNRTAYPLQRLPLRAAGGNLVTPGMAHPLPFYHCRLPAPALPPVQRHCSSLQKKRGARWEERCLGIRYIMKTQCNNSLKQCEEREISVLASPLSRRHATSLKYRFAFSLYNSKRHEEETKLAARWQRKRQLLRRSM